MDPTQLGPAALAALATGGGAPVWAAAIMFIINTVKGVDEFSGAITGHEKLLAFILSAILVVVAVYVATTMTPPAAELSPGGIILAIMSWFTVARMAMALHDDAARKPGSLGEPSSTEIARRDEAAIATIPVEAPLPAVDPNEVYPADPESPATPEDDPRVPAPPTP